MSQALEWFSALVGAEPLGRMRADFVEEFARRFVICGQMTAAPSGFPERRMGLRTGPSRWKSCCCCGPPTAMKLFSPSRSFSRKSRWAEKTVYPPGTRHFPDYFARAR